MHIRILITLIFMSLTLNHFGQDRPDPEMIRDAQENVCAIKIYLPEEEGFSLGCGVVLKTKVVDKNEYFIATAYHIIRPLLEDQKSLTTINVFDRNGYMYKVSNLNKDHIVWANPSMDAALLVLPRNIEPVDELEEGYAFPGLASLKIIGEPDWGQDIYLFGYRWLNEDTFIDILKKGILSVGTTELPGYEGHLVYLIDNMANKGMSGGLAFTEDGMGIGIISSYVYEGGDNFPNSDDLSVCLPLTIYFNAMGSLIISHGNDILNILDN